MSAAVAHTRAFVGRLAASSYQPGDDLPAVGTSTLVSGANADVESDQHRSYMWRLVVGYSPDLKFVCLQTPDCWPTVERLENCWFAETPIKLADIKAKFVDGIRVDAMEAIEACIEDDAAMAEVYLERDCIATGRRPPPRDEARARRSFARKHAALLPFRRN